MRAVGLLLSLSTFVGFTSRLALADEQIEVVGQLRRGHESTIHASASHHRHRKLFSWTNMLYSLHICSLSSNCPDSGSALCKCPDCSKPHPPHVAKYCSSSGGGSGSSSASSSSSSSYSAQSDGDDGSGYVEAQDAVVDEQETTGSAGGSDKKWFNALWALLVAAAVAIAIAAYIMRKRKQEDRKGLIDADADTDAMSAASGMMDSVSKGFGMMIGGAALSSGASDGSTGASLTGSVARRIRSTEQSIASGGVGSEMEEESMTPYIAEEESMAPSFVEVQSNRSRGTPSVYSSTDGSIELEGSYRPSSGSYAV